jgi:oligopeptide transport system permease protein
MRTVDVLYGLPYILLVVLVDLAAKPYFQKWAGWIMPSGPAANVSDVVTLLIAIGGVSWLTMARVIRGQVLSLRSQPFVEAARACGVGPVRIMTVHLLPNLVGPIVVYATLTVPTAILQESFLSFLGIGVQAPLPSWGNLASDGLQVLHSLSQPGQVVRWWLIVWPCVLLGLTLLALNFLGDALRARLDPRRARS